MLKKAMSKHAHSHTHTRNDAETMWCVTADMWQQRYGRIDSVNSCWEERAADVKAIQAAAGTFSYISCHTRGCRPSSPGHQHSRRLTA